MRKKMAAFCAALLLPLAAAAENTVEILPTAPPMPEPVSTSSEFAFEDLDPFYEPYSPYLPYMRPEISA